MKTFLLKFNILLFFVLLVWLMSSCQRPNVYSDATGIYTRAHGKYYYRNGDDLVPGKGYREYKLITEKTRPTVNHYGFVVNK